MQESLEKIQPQSEASKEKYNFPEIEALREDMVSLCRKMKVAIDERRYTILVSDEVGGRIPTLILRKIIKKIHPEKELRTIFVASGQKSDLPDYDSDRDKEDYKKMVKYLSVDPDDYVLLVTQFIYTGHTIQKLAVALGAVGYHLRGLDIAATTSFHISEEDLKEGIITSEDEDKMYEGEEYIENLRRPIFANNIFIGGMSQSTEELEKRHNRFTGVAKERKYNPSPILYTKFLEKYGKDMDFFSDEELKKIFGLEEGDSAEVIFTKKWETPENMKKYKELYEKPLTAEERKKLMEDIKKAREDVDALAREILKSVWNKT
ncbi:MAG: hypothetical protein UV05_C0009G0006 [candidate division CPR1 bacterium GW2011_GWA2_42_17]|uniref:Uncharacterized protein n=1 Tax=candidate division CPR1 bacterium GW2011_GWA2_42_17 TaxID=1618341 RepID=A0A0G0Z694_9BACT|nr:MAG: hypothetical protein UV05_C0009G0006 [candidate division CPR1 bacterium GW2011_GWA2_42_17]